MDQNFCLGSDCSISALCPKMKVTFPVTSCTQVGDWYQNKVDEVSILKAVSISFPRCHFWLTVVKAVLNLFLFFFFNFLSPCCFCLKCFNTPHQCFVKKKKIIEMLKSFQHAFTSLSTSEAVQASFWLCYIRHCMSLEKVRCIGVLYHLVNNY